MTRPEALAWTRERRGRANPTGKTTEQRKSSCLDVLVQRWGRRPEQLQIWRLELSQSLRCARRSGEEAEMQSPNAIYANTAFQNAVAISNRSKQRSASKTSV
ncbi:hypothetical protein Bca4012_010691 [Brassica carinata]